MYASQYERVSLVDITWRSYKWMRRLNRKKVILATIAHWTTSEISLIVYLPKTAVGVLSAKHGEIHKQVSFELSATVWHRIYDFKAFEQFQYDIVAISITRFWISFLRNVFSRSHFEFFFLTAIRARDPTGDVYKWDARERNEKNPSKVNRGKMAI